MSIIKTGPAHMLVFADGTAIVGANATLYESGVLHVHTEIEEVSTHILNCDVIWTSTAPAPAPKLGVVKPLRGEGGDDGKSE